MLVLLYCQFVTCFYNQLYHFYAFYQTNLLTRCQMPVPCFCCFCISEKSQQEISSDCPQNLRGLFLRQDEYRVRRTAWEATHRAEAPPAAAQGGPAGGARPCPWGTSSAPSDAYKLPHDLKTSRRPLFSRNSTPTRRHRKP